MSPAALAASAAVFLFPMSCLPTDFDVIVVGGGPAGSICAAMCAKGGLRTLLLERALFPREKVCGDCLNPTCWPVLDRMGVADAVLALPHSRLTEVSFIGIDGRTLSIPLPATGRGEIAVKRSLLDSVLLEHARKLGADVRENCAVTQIDPGWTVHVGAEPFSTRWLVAADGRNSTVARALGLLPAPSRDRVALQTHLPAPADFGARVAMQFLPEGYAGMASVGNGELNLCLVARPPDLEKVKHWAANRFQLPTDKVWRTITPLARRAISPRHDHLLLIGDAARVVEPFTGEGIAYALRTGELAGHHLLQGDLRGFAQAQRRLYRGRLWVNDLARMVCLRPPLASWLLRQPRALRFLTSKVVGAGG